MKTREEAARFLEQYMDKNECPRDKGGCHHYGWQDLRVLLDFIYEGTPVNVKEELSND